MARASEPFRLFFTPAELQTFLKGFGFTQIEQLASKEINTWYFDGRPDGLAVSGAAGRIVSAWT